MVGEKLLVNLNGGLMSKLSKEIAEIILNELKIYTGQEMVDDDAFLVSNKIANKLVINIEKENENA